MFGFRFSVFGFRFSRGLPNRPVALHQLRVVQTRMPDRHNSLL